MRTCPAIGRRPGRAPRSPELSPAAPRLDTARSFDGISLGLSVQIALLIIPMRIFPVRKVPCHFQIQGDRDESLTPLGTGALGSLGD